MFDKSTGSTAETGDSGITGSPEIADPAPPPREPRDFRARLRNLARALAEAGRSMPRVLALVWQASPRLTIGLALSTVIAGLMPVATAMTARLLVDSVANAINVHKNQLTDHGLIGPVAGISIQTTTLGVIIAAVTIQFLMFMLSASAASARGIVSELLQQRITQDIQLRVMNHAGKLDLAFFEDAASYDLIRQAQQEAAARPVTMIGNMCGFIQNLIAFVSIVALLFTLSPWVALAAVLAPVPAFLTDSRYSKIGFAVSMWSSPIRRRMQYLFGLVTTDSYAKEVKLFGLGPYFSARFRALGMVFYRRLRRQVTSRGLASMTLGGITTLVTSLTCLYIAVRAAFGHLSIGDLVMYTAAAAALQTAAQGVFADITGMYENNLYMNTLHRLLATRPNITTPPDPRPIPVPMRGHIVFEHVTFCYPGSEVPALRDVSFELPPGRTLAVVGRNGAGKSTLIKLVCRLYDPVEGRILLDGVDLRDLDPDELYARVSATFQDYVSYQATVAENIGLGDVDRILDRERIELAAVKGGADDLIAGMPERYDTPLGKWFERGVNLSGGEWQKVALSRAFMRDANILVFDEPTSALDPTSEHELFLRLRDLAHDRSAIYVSHRFSTVRQADRILLLSHGRIAEEGTHEELLSAGAEYAQLFLTQASSYVDINVSGNGTVLKG